jgi:hypothetical protein
LKNLQVKIKKLDNESQRQNEIIYRADFQIQLMERKIPSAQGFFFFFVILKIIYFKCEKR